MAARAARAYGTAVGAYGMGKAGYNVATGQGTVGDMITLAMPAIGYGLGKLAGRVISAPRGVGCFAAGTPILTPEGSKPVEAIQPGDWVLALPEDNPGAEVMPRMVEEVFENYLPTLYLRVSGRTIRTTAEHPFWVRNHRWVAAQQLMPGDETQGL